jgi:hypothetical protein
MDHIAIMKKSWKLIPKIIDRTKKIESRWGINKSSPWGRISVGDTIYFKNSGEPVTVKTKVKRVKEFTDLNPDKVRTILEKYGSEVGIDIHDLESTIIWARNKRYCTLIYLESPKKVRPFDINKKGFGMAAAWITVKNYRDVLVHYPEPCK